MKLSLFWRLYISVSLAVMLTAIILYGLLNIYLFHDAENDFVVDAQQEFQQIRTAHQHGQLNRQWLAQFKAYSHFDISLIDSEANTTLSDAYQYQGSSDDLKIYQHDHTGGMAALLHLKNPPFHILLSDREEAEHGAVYFEDELSEEDWVEAFSLPLLISLIIAVLAIVALLISRAIERPVSSLEHTLSQFAKGDKTVRASENSPPPISGLAQHFNQMASTIEQQHQDQNTMTHAIAHELRTPLTRMQMALGILSDKQLTESDREALLHDLESYVDDMDELTQAVLTLGRLQQGRQQEKPPLFAVRQLLEARTAYHQKPDIHVTKDINEQCNVAMPEMHFQLLLDNLLKNAFQYAHGHIRVSCHHNQGFELSIEDDGPGIDDKAKAQILRPFSRLDTSRNRETGGFGLGLAITDSLVRMYGGQLTVTDSALGGACFKCSFPTQGQSH